MCLSDPVHRRPVNEKYCSHLRREELVRYCNQDVSCAEWAYGDTSPVSSISIFFLLHAEIFFFYYQLIKFLFHKTSFHTYLASSKLTLLNYYECGF